MRHTPQLVLAIISILSGGAALAAAPPAPDMTSLEAALFGRSVQGRVQVGDETRLRFLSPEVSDKEVRAQEKVRKGASLVWSEEIRYPGASYIAPHFSRFHLPSPSHLVVRAPDGSRSWEYTGFGKGELGRTEGFWGIHIPGDIAVLELYADRPLSAGVVEVDSFAHGFPRDVLGALDEPEAICGPDDSNWAKCYQSSEPTIYDRSRAVARLLINGTGACTGWLVGSAGHLMTNQHCIGSASDALNTDYEFMAEGATCGTNCASWFACPGTVVATSATLVKVNAPLDYALVQLPTNPTGTYGYLRMRTTAPSINERIYIPGHPAAWGKRIAVNSTHSSDASGKCEVYSLNEPPCSGGPGDVGYFCDTQGGSSGSPVLAYSDHLVVSLHHCAFCPNRGVPITAVISDLGASLPPNSTGAGCSAFIPQIVKFTQTGSSNVSFLKCPAGQKVLSGGCTDDFTSTSLMTTRPWGDDGWTCDFKTQPGSLTSWAVCESSADTSCRGVTTVRNTVSSGTTVSVACPSTQQVIGGGCSDDFTSTDLRTSMPSGNGWSCRFVTNPGSLTAYALCAAPAPGATIQTVSLTQTSSNVSFIKCPAGKRVLGGGCRDDLGTTLLQSTYPWLNDGWVCNFQNVTGSLTVYALCE